MKREELFLGVCIFLLIIVTGFSAPILDKLKMLNWNEPISAGLKGLFRAQPLHSIAEISIEKETMEASLGNVGMETSQVGVSQKKGVDPKALGITPPRVFGKKPVLKTDPIEPKRKGAVDEEPPKS